MSDMVYEFEICIMRQELNYQNRIEYENVGSDFLAFTYAHTTLLTFYAAGIPDDIFRAALANEIWIRLGQTTDSRQKMACRQFFGTDKCT